VRACQVLRASPLFVWRNDKGVPWCDVIRESARKEFDAARRARKRRALNASTHALVRAHVRSRICSLKPRRGAER
jgi:hypothetical protein